MRTIIWFLFFLVGLSWPKLAAQSPFYAYHTKVIHTSTDYFGKYADLIVVIGQGHQLEFTRRTQYLPRWVTPTGTFMVDDFFPGRDSDHEFSYNYVRLIEQSAEKIVVHWRYIPDIDAIDRANENLNPTFLEGFTSAVHEIFTIYPTGKVERVVKDARNSKYHSWTKQGYADRQLLELTEKGVVHGSVEWGDKSLTPMSPVDKSRVVDTRTLSSPILTWSFDEGGGDYPEELIEDLPDILTYEPETFIDHTIESRTLAFHPIRGHGAVYKKGVSGTSLGFDGYYTGVFVPKIAAEQGTTYFNENGHPELTEAMSLEAWIALDVYPYNEAPIIHHSENFGEKGFYFGVGPYGKLIFRVNGQEVISEEPIDLYRWTYVAAIYGRESMSIYVDGVSIATTSAQGHFEQPDTDFMVGLNTEKERCTDYVRGPMQNIPFLYGIQGLLDEVKVYDTALSPKQIKTHYQTFVPKDLHSPLEKAVLPGENGVGETFGATYKTLQHHELWDKMWRLPEQADIVVKFDHNPASVVYWHGTNFAANWVTDNNRWMADQSSEIFTKHGCSEHMADKQTRHSYARIIENHEARVVIHWRYPCVDVGYTCTNRRNWTDEYHTIYPDGTAVRTVAFNNTKAPGFQDIQYFTNPGETALDVIHLNAMTVANIAGETLELVWEKPNKNPPQQLEDATIEWINPKSDWKVFTIFQGPGITTWGHAEQSSYTDDPFAGPWNHWPVSLLPSDGRYAIGHDRVTHFAVGANDNAPIHGGMIHYGFTNQSVETVIPIARYWQRPPVLVPQKGIQAADYLKEEKAYHIVGDGQSSLRFAIQADANSPLIHPAFVISNFSPAKLSLTIDGQQITDKNDLKIGKAYDVQGNPQTIIWLRKETYKTVSMTVRGLD
ncbi:MAG: LamG domain-containing protein [Bacteroidota bacterium]